MAVDYFSISVKNAIGTLKMIVFNLYIALIVMIF
jgi:hypothetical protein